MNLVCNDLATKAELQIVQADIDTLRNQINNILGQNDDGSITDVLQFGLIGGSTILASRLTMAETAVQGVQLTGSVGGDIAKEIAEGTAQLVSTRGNGTTGSLPQLTNVVKKSASKTIATKTVAAKAAATSASAISVLASLTQIAVSFGLNIATVNILGNRIDIVENSLIKGQNDYANQTIKIFNKFQDDYDAMVDELDNAQTTINDQQVTIDEAKTQIEQNFNDINGLVDKNDEFEKELKKANKTIKQVSADLEDLEATYNEDIGETKEAIDSLKTTVKKAGDNIEILQKNIDIQKESIENLQAKVELQEITITQLSILLSINRVEIIQLKADIAANNDLTTAQVQSLEAKIKILENQSKSGGGVPVGTQESIVNSQVKTVELLDKLTGQDSNYSTTYFDIVNQQSGFETTVNNLLANVPDVTNLSSNPQNPQVTPQELDTALADFKVDLNTDFQTIIAAIIAGTVTPQLDTITNQTTQNSLSNAAETGVCNAASPNGCLTNNITNPINNNLSGLGQGLGLGLDGTNLLLNNSILGRITTMQNFLNQAWGSTTIQKSLNALNTVLAFHNATMLSRNLAQSVGDTISLVLNSLPIPGFDGVDIDVTQFVSQKLTQFSQALIGATNYQTIVEGWNSANRILVAGQGVLSATHGIKNALQEGQEVIANRVGTLGNSFLEQGIFEENSYPWMTTDTDFRSPFTGFTQRIAGLTEMVDEVNQLVQSGIEVQENVNQLWDNTQNALTASEELQDAFTQFDLTREAEDVTQETDSASPDISNTDLAKNES